LFAEQVGHKAGLLSPGFSSAIKLPGLTPRRVKDMARSAGWSGLNHPFFQEMPIGAAGGIVKM
jgi:hypothetical protein